MNSAGLVTLRTADVADSLRLAELHVAAWHDAYRGMVPDSMLASVSIDRREAMWRGILSEPAGPAATVVHLAEAGPQLAGFASSGPQRAEHLQERGFDGEVSAIYVKRSSHRQGLGRLLMSAAARSLQQRGFRAASLWVLHGNSQARRFYEALGGRLLDERDDAREDAVLIEVAYGWPQIGGLNPAAIASE